MSSIPSDLLPLGRDATWVFVGDSITDAGKTQTPDRLGRGYVRIVHDYLLAKAPADMPRILNRGVGGDESGHVAARWTRDVVSADPDVVSLCVGVNDVWRQLDGRGSGTLLADYVAVLGKLLEDLADACPACKIVLCEPTLIEPPAPAKGTAMLLPYVMAVRELAATHRAVVNVVGFHHACLAAQAARPEVAWWPDGVHPSDAGHMLLARTWLATNHLL